MPEVLFPTGNKSKSLMEQVTKMLTGHIDKTYIRKMFHFSVVSKALQFLSSAGW